MSLVCLMMFLLVSILTVLSDPVQQWTTRGLEDNTDLVDDILFDPEACQERSTDSIYRYRWDLRGLASAPLTFEARAGNDVRIGLSAADHDLDFMYEIVIGGDDNTRSFIRRDVGARLVEVDTPGVLSVAEFRGFWIDWSTDGTISVGKQSQRTPFMQWTDPHPLPVLYVGYTTAYGSSGDFKFNC